MEGHPTEPALSRIESALARIEAAAERIGRKDPDLPARHEALRDAVSDTLQQLDALIGSRTDSAG